MRQTQNFTLDAELNKLRNDLAFSETLDYSSKPKFTPRNIIQGAASRLYRIEEELIDLKTALTYAESFSNPVYSNLIKVYRQVVMNYKVSSVMNIRKNFVMSKDFFIKKDGVITDDKQLKSFFGKAWFGKCIDACLESIYWGYTLLFIEGIDENGNVIGVQSVQRQNVNPRTKRITSTPWSIFSGADFEKGAIAPYCILVSDSEDNMYEGILSKISIPAIFLSKALSNYAVHSERFGSPNIAYMSQTHDDDKADEIMYYLSNFNNLSYGMFPKEDEIKLIESSAVSDTLYTSLISACERAIAQIVLSADPTESAQYVGSSQNKISVVSINSLIDVKFVETCINDKLLPKLIALGLDFLEGVSIAFDKQSKLDPTQEFQMALQLINSGKYSLPDTYFHERYGIPVVSVQPDLFPDTNTINEDLNLSDITATDSEDKDNGVTVFNPKDPDSLKTIGNL